MSSPAVARREVERMPAPVTLLPPAAAADAGRLPRILFVITLSELGGAQTCVAELLPGLCSEFDVLVAAGGDGPLREAAEEAGARWVGLRHMRRELGARDVAGLAELVRVIRRERPAIVHAHSSKAGILARTAAAMCGTPVRMYTSHGWAFNAQPGLRARAYKTAEQLAAPLTDVIVCPARSEAEIGLRARACRPEGIAVIPTGVAIPPERPRLHRDGPPTLISVGRMKAPKDFGTLLEALARIGDVEYEAQLVGDGPERPELERLARSLGLGERVRFLGARPDATELVAGADCFVLSSRSECLPVSILEALARGVPVVASAVGGVPELLDGGRCGLLVPPGDAGSLASALAGLLADAALRTRLGQAGRREALARHDLGRYRSAHVALYRSLLASRVPA